MIRRIRFGHRKTRQPLGWIALVSGIGALCFASYWHQHVAEALGSVVQLQAEAAKAAQAQQQAAQKASLRPEVIAERERSARALAEAGRPWLGALATIEQAVTPPNFLLSLHMDGPADQLRLDLETADLADALELVERLQNKETLRNVMLASHEQVQMPDGKSVLHFVIMAKLSATPVQQ